MTGIYSGTSPHFLDPNTLLVFNSDTWQTLDRYAVGASGLVPVNTSTDSSTLNHFGSFKLDKGIAYADPGGVADPSTQPATQLGSFPGPAGAFYGSIQNATPDSSLRRVFFLTANANASSVNSITAYDQATFLPSTTIPIDMPTVEGNTSYATVDLIRWGQDGLAALTNGGHIYLVRGAAVTPELLNRNTAATLSASSAATIPVGSGNTLFILTGANFVPGVAATWNGNYRVTTIVDATHISVAIPASDLAAAGTGSLVATNPGAPPSAALSVTVQ